MRYGFEIALVALLALAAGLTSCATRWDVCAVDTWDHPQKPRPAVEARVQCSRTVLCDEFKDGRCDGKPLAEKTK